ncbi:MAG: CapA family protein [Helicobacteraceae bacterium]|jgi:poly-gamma-glutamate synthesis protein (capsule biosynthesis protein)|nr:CapA family protein [Helicobacteraceae bacterium]
MIPAGMPDLSAISLRKSAALAFFALIAAAFLGCSVQQAAPPKEVEIVLIAAGDNLIHSRLIADAKNKDGYDFTPIYEKIKPLVKSADLAFINQETPIAGESFGYSGYPAFNAPTAVGDAIYETGFRVINHASNHAMDKGKRAVLAMINFWEKRPDAIVLGIHASKEDRAKKRIVSIKGVKIGFLAYTYGLNGIRLPKDSPYLVSMIDLGVMAEEIDALRPLCDFLLVSMHWGTEYAHVPDKQQERLAAFLAEHKVDLIIGHHPHVLQPVRWVQRQDGAKTLVYFSLGNFVSAQSKKPRMLGGIARVVLGAKGGSVGIKSAALLGSVTHFERGFRGFKVYALESYTEEIARLHALAAAPERMDLSYLRKLYLSIVAEEFRAPLDK